MVKIDRATRMKDSDVSHDDAEEFLKSETENQDPFQETKSETLAGKVAQQVAVVSGAKNPMERFANKEDHDDATSLQEMQRLGDGEKQEVFQVEYHDLPVSDIHSKLFKTKNKNEAIACLSILIEKGLLPGDDPMFLKVLNRFQEDVKFKIPEDLNTPLPELLKKVSTALSKFIPAKYYQEFEKDITKIKEQCREATDLEFSSYEEQPQTRTKILSGILENWKKGENLRDIDPARYEGFLMNSFKYDKLDSSSSLESEERFYFLILGVTVKNTSGQSLLSRDVFERFAAEFISDCGELEFFTDKSSWKKDGKIVEPNSRGAEQRSWDSSDYIEWGNMLGSNGRSFAPNKFLIKRFFSENIQKSPAVRVRLKKLQEYRANGILPKNAA